MSLLLPLSVVVAGEAAMVWAWLHGFGWHALAAHLLACAVLVAALPWHRQGRWAGGLRLLAIMLPALGPFALLAGLVALVAAPRLLLQSSDPEAWRAILFPAADAHSLEARLKHLTEYAAAQREAGQVAPFADVLTQGDLPQQERVVALMAREYRPDFAPLLRQALNAPARPLRAQAAAALTLVNTRLGADVQEMRRAGDPAALARKLADLAHSGLLDPDRARALRAEAVELWRSQVAAEPRDASSVATLGRDILQMDDVHAARETLEGAYARGLVSASLIAWLAEARFRSGDLAGVAALIQAHRTELAPLREAMSPMAPALELWLGEARA